VLVHGKALHISVDFFGLAIVGEGGLRGSQLVLIIEVIVLFYLSIEGSSSQVSCTIIIILLLVRGTPIHGPAESVPFLFSLPRR
jgi:hypothetical protein